MKLGQTWAHHVFDECKWMRYVTFDELCFNALAYTQQTLACFLKPMSKYSSDGFGFDVL